MARLALLVLLASLVAGCAASPSTKTPATVDATGAAPSLRLVDLGPGGPEPVVRALPGGGLAVAAQDAEGGAPRVWTSRDGATFTPTRVAGAGAGEVDLAASERALYLTQLGTTGNVISVSRDGGATWQSSALAPQSQYFDREWIGVDDAGRVYVVSRPQGDNTLSQVSRSDDDGLTFLPQGDPWDAAHEPGLTNGNLVAWSGGVSMPYVCRDGAGVCVATSANRGVAWTRALARESPAGVGHVYASLAATGDGLVVAWSEPVEGRAAVFTASSSDGATWSAAKRVSSQDESAILPWVASGGGRTWVVWLSTTAKIEAGDDKAAETSAWVVAGARTDGKGAPTAEARALSDAVHVGAVSPPVARGGAAAFDRLFGDFFTAIVDGSGKLVVASERDTGPGSASHVVLLRE